MNLNIKAIDTCTDIPESIRVVDNRHANQADDHLNGLKTYAINGLSSTRAEVKGVSMEVFIYGTPL